MRLLETSTLAFQEFFEPKIPPYAILSHTWADDEVSLQDMQIVISARTKQINDAATQKILGRAGYHKIKESCRQAINDGFAYCWIDTCCIDKTSSAELSEAINSMYRWYRESELCYVHLVDLGPRLDLTAPLKDTLPSFSKCRYWTRGWTLQELVAPRRVVFFTADWEPYGTKCAPNDPSLKQVYKHLPDLAPHITRITNIPKHAFSGEDLDLFSVAQRMSWASNRQTTRVEDAAYCLLGIFDVNMPLLYGEGTKAFQRLQEEIIKISDDQTIFAWTDFEQRTSLDAYSGLLAPSAAAFKDAGDIVTIPPEPNQRSFTVTNKGLHIELGIHQQSMPKVWETGDGNSLVASLNCSLVSNPLVRLGICLSEPWSFEDDLFADDKTKLDISRLSRSPGTTPRIFRDDRYHNPVQILQTPPMRFQRDMYISLSRPRQKSAQSQSFVPGFYLRSLSLPHGYSVQNRWPEGGWSMDGRALLGNEQLYGALFLSSRQAVFPPFTVFLKRNEDSTEYSCTIKVDYRVPTGDVIKEMNWELCDSTEASLRWKPPSAKEPVVIKIRVHVSDRMGLRRVILTIE